MSKIFYKYYVLSIKPFFSRYNKLLKVIHQTSQDLLKALKGLLVMSQELENMSNSLFNNAVPGLWAKNVSKRSLFA
jgi:hypothetical protein